MFKLPLKLNFKLPGSKKIGGSFFTIDIGSKAIKCLAFKLDEESTNTVKLIGAAKVLLEPNTVRSGSLIEVEKIVDSVDMALFKAIEGIEEEIGDVIFGIGGDECINLVTTVKVNRGTTDEISEKEIRELNQRVFDSAYSQAMSKILRTTGNTDTEIELITSSTVYSKLDDQHADTLVGKSGRKIETAMFTAFSPKYHLDSIQEVASKLKLNILAATSNMYALTQSLKSYTNNDLMDAVIIDIGSDKSEVGIVFGGGVVSSKTINVGGNQFTNSLTESMGLSFIEAERKKHDYTFGNLEDSELIKIESILNEITSIWLSGMEILFSEFNGVKTFPTDIYLTGGTSKLPLITEALETKPWTKSIPFREPPQFSKISTKDFIHIHDVTGEADQAEYVIPAALSTIYLEIIKNAT